MGAVAPFGRGSAVVVLGGETYGEGGAESGGPQQLRGLEVFLQSSSSSPHHEKNFSSPLTMEPLTSFLDPGKCKFLQPPSLPEGEGRTAMGCCVGYGWPQIGPTFATARSGGLSLPY